MYFALVISNKIPEKILIYESSFCVLGKNNKMVKIRTCKKFVPYSIILKTAAHGA